MNKATPTGAVRTKPSKTPTTTHDHTHPGWRDLLAVPEHRGRRWLTHVQHLYPTNCFDRGGPIRTVRTGIEKRHRPEAAPGGGYDLAEPPKKNDPVTAIPDVLPLEFGRAEAA